MAKRKKPRGPAIPLDELHAALAHAARMYEAHQRARIRLANQIGALTRGGVDGVWLAEMARAAEVLETSEDQWGAQIETYAAQHPLAEWIESVPGVGLRLFGRLMGRIGTLDRFSGVGPNGKPRGPANLWAYLGMHVIDGAAPKRRAGELSNWSAIGHTICHLIGASFVKVGKGPYHDHYRKRRDAVMARPGTGPSGCPLGGQVHRREIRARDVETGWDRKTGSQAVTPCRREEEGKLISAHVNADAMRVAAKMFLRDLWREWRRLKGQEDSAIQGVDAE